MTCIMLPYVAAVKNVSGKSMKFLPYKLSIDKINLRRVL